MDLSIKTLLQSNIELIRLEIEQLTFNKQVITRDLSKKIAKLARYKKQLNVLNQSDNISIKLSDYFSQEELDEYTGATEMLFEPDMKWYDWLDWFYEELPFIKDKHITLTGLMSNKTYSFEDIPHNVIVKVMSNRIFVMLDEPVVINLNNINLFQLLSV